MKKEYSKPDINVVEINVEDIITTSGVVAKTVNPNEWDLDNPDNVWFND